MDTLWAASYIALWIIVVVLSFVVMGLLRQLGLIQMRLGPEPGALITFEGLDRGTPAPEFERLDVNTGEPVRLSDFRGKRVLLTLLSTGCVACRELVPHLNRLAREEDGNIHVLAVCHGSAYNCSRFARAYGLQITTLADPENLVGGTYETNTTPFTFLIDEKGVVLIRGIANSWPQLEALLREEGTLQTHDFAPDDHPQQMPGNANSRQVEWQESQSRGTDRPRASGAMRDSR